LTARFTSSRGTSSSRATRASSRPRGAYVAALRELGARDEQQDDELHHSGRVERLEKLGYAKPASPEMLEAYSRSTANLMVKGLFR